MTPREKRLAIDGTTGLVVISVAAALANLTWRLAGEAGGASPVAAAASSYVRPAPPPDLSALLGAAPFGTANAAPVATAANLGLTLRGVLFAEPASASTALLAGAQGPSVGYAVGDTLPGGARLDRIAEDYVVLAIGGQLAPLYFPNDERAKRPPPVAVQPAASAADPRAGVDAIRALLPPSVRGAAPGAPPAGNTAPGAAGLVARLGATVTPQGLQFGAGLPPELRGAGLMPGDVVTSINGVSAAAFANDGRMIGQARSAGQARAEVVRNGMRLTLSVPFR